MPLCGPPETAASVCATVDCSPSSHARWPATAVQSGSVLAAFSTAGIAATRHPPVPPEPVLVSSFGGVSSCGTGSVDVELVAFRILHPDRVVIEPVGSERSGDGGAERGQAP